MQFSMLIYHDEKKFKALPKDVQNRVHRACGAWHDELVASGQSKAAIGLQASVETKSLRELDGDVNVMDGPFVETKEVLGGLEVLDCRDVAEALAIARRFPALRAGARLELRPHVPGSICQA